MTLKKNLKRALLITISIVILLIGIVFYNISPMLFMNPTETGSIPNTDIYAIKNARNTIYFIKTENSYIMIDAGSDVTGLETSLKEHEIHTNDVKWIFLTHSDYDHVAALSLFPNATVYMGEDELDLVNGTIKRNAFSNNSIPTSVGISLLKDGEELLFDDAKIECIHAPGHTNGSMLYLIDETYLFTGDAFMIRNGKLDVHPFTMDKERSKQTIEMQKELINNNNYIVFTSHYGYYDNVQFE